MVVVRCELLAVGPGRVIGVVDTLLVLVVLVLAQVLEGERAVPEGWDVDPVAAALAMPVLVLLWRVADLL